MQPEYIGTMGPSIMNTEIIQALCKEGLSTIRFNMSHVDYNIEEIVTKLNQMEKNTNFKIQTMMDTRGPEVRLEIKENKEIKVGDKLILGQDFSINCNYELLEIGDVLQIDDGKVLLKVANKLASGKFLCSSLTEGKLKKGAGVYLEKLNKTIPFLSQEDIKDIELAFTLNLDWIACSFVRTKEDIKSIFKIKEKYPNAKTKIMAKIETREAIHNFDDILEVSDGIMIARGDLGTVYPVYLIAMLQELLTKKVLSVNKKLVVATGFLKSMKKSLLPERSEVNDLYHTFKSGVTTILFSGETAIADSPLQVLKIANKIYESAQIQDLNMSKRDPSCTLK